MSLVKGLEDVLRDRIMDVEGGVDGVVKLCCTLNEIHWNEVDADDCLGRPL